MHLVSFLLRSTKTVANNINKVVHCRPTDVANIDVKWRHKLSTVQFDIGIRLWTVEAHYCDTSVQHV